MLEILDRDGKLPDHYPYPVQVWRFSRDLTRIFLGGAMIGYGQPGPFGAAVEEIIAEEVDTLIARTAGNP